VKGEGDFEVVS